MDYNYSYNAGGGAAAAFLIVMWIVMLVFAVLAIIGLWKTLIKAGLPGWAAIIPFYNEYNVVKMSNRPVYFFWIMLGCSLFMWIPIVNFLLAIGLLVLWIFIALDIAANFGQSTGFAVLLIIFPSIMFLILGFGSYRYARVAPAGSAGFGAPTGTGMPPTPPTPPVPMGGNYAAPPAPLSPPPAPLRPPSAPLSPPTTAPAPVTPPAQAAPAAAPAAPAPPAPPANMPPASSPPPAPPL